MSKELETQIKALTEKCDAQAAEIAGLTKGLKAAKTDIKRVGEIQKKLMAKVEGNIEKPSTTVEKKVYTGKRTFETAAGDVREFKKYVREIPLRDKTWGIEEALGCPEVLEALVKMNSGLLKPVASK